MAKMTYYVVQAFDVDARGRASPAEPVLAKSAEQAERMASRMAETKGGALAFSRSGDPDLGEYEDAVILARCGLVPDQFIEAMAA